MDVNTKTPAALTAAISVTLLLWTAVSSAHEISIPNSFQSGSSAVAQEVNDNFNVVESGVNDNASQIESIQAALDALQAELDELKTTTGDDLSELDEIEAPENGTEVLVIDDDTKAVTTVGAIRGVVASDGEGINIAVNSPINTIDPEVHSSLIAGGGYGGVGNFIGVGEGYTPGQANVAVISGGYDNINNQLAGTVAGGAHHLLDAAGNHGTISGGSKNSLYEGHYSTIAGGTLNSATGDKGTIGGGAENYIDASYGTISGGIQNSIDATSSSIAGGHTNTITETAPYSTVVGGQNVTVASKYSAAFGNNVIANSHGSLAFSGKTIAEPGDAQAVQMHLSGNSSDSQSLILLSAAPSYKPQIPADTAWAGSGVVLARDTNTGEVSAWRLPVVAGINSGSGWTAKGLDGDKELLVDQIGLNGQNMNVVVSNSNGLFQLYVQGLPAREIHWGAYLAVTQIR